MVYLFLSVLQLFSLNVEQTNALQKASEHLLYSVDRVEVTIEGVEREIVIVGEMHRKTEAATDIGREVIAAFPYRAIEMPPISDMEQSKIQAVLMGIAYGIDRTVSKVRDLLGYKKGTSSVLDALHRGFFISQENQIIYNGYYLGELREDGAYYDHSRVAVLVNMLPHDQVASFFTSLKIYVDKTLETRKRVDPSFLQVSGINSFPLRAAPVLPGFINELTLGIEYGYLNHFSSRDDRMTRNIISMLSQNPEATQLLVIVGKLHVEPIKKLLQYAN